MTYRVALDQKAMNIMDERKRPAKESAGSPSPKRTNSLATGSRSEDAHVPPLVPAGQQAKMIRYNDEIHLSIDICPLMKRIMDTWPVQRLHDLKQLGTANMVYACATHTRFEHSVGVAHLAREMCKRLQLRHPSFGVTNKDVLCVTLAGLLHDIGHGPFSHLYEQFREEVQEEILRDSERRELYEKFPEVPTDWNHEKSSLMLVDVVLEELGVAIDMSRLDEPLRQIANITSAESIRCYWDECEDDDDEKRKREILTSRDWTFIKECIFGGPIPEVVECFGKNERIGRLDPRLEWLYDIVSNRHNGIDVDKVDYFARDARHTLNEAGNIDISIINEACIACADCSSPSTCERCRTKKYHYQICYPKKCVERVIDFYRNRGRYHEFVYQHKTSVAAGYMVMDILKLADPYFLIPTEKVGVNLPISRAFSNARAFEMLRDSVVDNIAFSTTPDLKEARELAMRYKRRELYKMSNEKILDMNNPKHKHIWNEVREKPDSIIDEMLNLKGVHSDQPNALTKADIIVKCASWHQGKNGHNPVTFVRFLEKDVPQFTTKRKGDDSQMATKIKEEEYSMHLSRAFQKHVIRVYCRDPSKRDLLFHVFETFWQNSSEITNDGGPGTPFATTYHGEEDSDSSVDGFSGEAALLTQEYGDSGDDSDMHTPMKASGNSKMASPSPIPLRRRY